MKKVNFGSGTVSPPGWISLDNSPSVILAKIPFSRYIKWILFKLKIISKQALETNWPPNIIFWDIRLGIPFKSNSVNVIFSSHVLEHLSQKQATKFLENCYKILKNKGIIRIVVPDLNISINKFLKESKKKKLVEATNNLVSTIFEDGRHKWMYNHSSLSKILSEIGFKDIKKLDYRKSKIEDIMKLETPKLKYQTSLYIEAAKYVNPD